MNAIELEAVLRNRDRRRTRNAVVLGIPLVIALLAAWMWRQSSQESPFLEDARMSGYKAGVGRPVNRSVSDMKAAR